MDARLLKVCLVLLSPALMGASFRTPNFVVTATSPEVARQVGEAAEHYRKQLAAEWLGSELPRWAAPCPIKVKVGQLGAGGATTFSFFPNAQGSAEVCNWDMQIQGSLERILDSVLPHEVSHTIFACHFRRPLPRWADEGAATLAEHESERRRQVLTVQQVIDTGRRIPLKNLLNIKDYPTKMEDVLTLYAEGYSLAELLVQEGGRSRYLRFLADAHQQGWDKAVQTHYSYRGVEGLEQRWHDWVIAGSPEVELPQGQLLADSSKNRPLEQAKTIVRGQKPPEDPFLADSVIALKEASPSPGGSPRTAPQPRERPLPKNEAKPRPKFETPASAEMTKPNPAEEQRTTEGDARTRARTAKPQEADDQSALPLPRTNQKTNEKQSVQVAEARTSAKLRQVTEWSEFPQDPRPSPLIVPGRNRSGARR